MLQRVLLLLDLRSTADVDFDAICSKATLVSVIEFAKLIHELDKRNLIQPGTPLETLAVTVLLTAPDKTTKVVNVLRASRPKNINLKNLWQKTKQVLRFLFDRTLVDGPRAQPSRPDFEWLDQVLNLSKAPASGKIMFKDCVAANRCSEGMFFVSKCPCSPHVRTSMFYTCSQRRFRRCHSNAPKILH